MIIAVANSKGGVGKSTLSVHLAAWLSHHGHRVTLADCDVQQSSSQWIQEAAPEVRAVCLKNSDDILSNIHAIAGEADYVIADGPGSLAETSLALLLTADVAIVPCKASGLEIRALDAATKVLRHAQMVRGGPPNAMIVLTMVGKNYRLTQDMRDSAEMLNMSIADKAMTLRQSYADAPGQGATVWNLKARAKESAKELDQLFSELLPDAIKAKPARRLAAAK